MTKSTALSRFTPSLLDLETLEAIFVQRHRLAERLENIHNLPSPEASKHHTLLIGSRGIGKTHLLSLVFQRLQKVPDLAQRQLIAWLREDGWEISSYLDLLLCILRTLAIEYKDKELSEKTQSLIELKPNHAEQEAEVLIINKCRGKSLLLLVENLDEIFKGLAKPGQEKFRAFIQNGSFMAILATSQGLFNGVSLRSCPFYGFFEVSHLKQLSFDDAVTMLGKIAEHQGDETLATLLSTPHGRARIRAVHHLAGGNPRLYVVFSQFLSRESLESLVDPLMQMLDDLTPYYQARMSHLSAQQRKIVAFLCDRGNAVVVKDIAKNNFMSSQTASGQLKKLSEMGYVCAHKSGRESFYEMQEPLMRLALELKKHRGGPIRLFVEFLKLWYTEDELLQLKALSDENRDENDYLNRAIEAKENNNDEPVIKACENDYWSSFHKDDIEKANELAEELLVHRPSGLNWLKKASCLQKLNDNEAAVAAVNAATPLCTGNPKALGDCAWILLKLNQNEDALSCHDKALKGDPSNSSAWNNRGVNLDRLCRRDEAKKSFEKAASLMNPKNHQQWQSLGLYQKNLGQHENSIISLNQALTLAPDDVKSWSLKSDSLQQLGKLQQSIASYKKLLELKPKDAHAWSSLATIQIKLGQNIEANYSCDKAIELDVNDARIWTNKALSLLYSGELTNSLSALDKALALNPKESHYWANRGVALGNIERHEEAILSFEKSFEIEPETFNFLHRSNYAAILMTAGFWDKGTQIMDETLARLACSDETENKKDVHIIGNLLIRTRDEVSWHRHISIWVKLFGKHNLFPQFGKSLVHSIHLFSIPWIDQPAMDKWNETWQKMCGDIKELELHLRLLDISVRYWEKKNDRVLLELPIEERKILEPVLGIYPE